MFCNHCGTQNLDTATFCQRCGKPIGIAKDEQIPPPPPTTMLTGQSPTNVLAQRKNRGYVIAGSGALVALYTFFFIPYFTTNSDLFGLEHWSASHAGVGDGLLWLDALLSALALAVALLLMFRSNPFGMTTTPLATQTRWGVYALIGSGVLSILIQLLIALITAVELQGSADVGYYYHFDIGYWVYILAMGAVIVGGMIARRMLTSPLPPQAQKWQQPPSMR